VGGENWETRLARSRAGLASLGPIFTPLVRWGPPNAPEPLDITHLLLHAKSTLVLAVLFCVFENFVERFWGRDVPRRAGPKQAQNPPAQLRRGSGVTTRSRDVRALTLWQDWTRNKVH
jgi:hypothetical protein